METVGYGNTKVRGADDAQAERVREWTTRAHLEFLTYERAL